jgi:hypothetical protein
MLDNAILRVEADNTAYALDNLIKNKRDEIEDLVDADILETKVNNLKLSLAEGKETGILSSIENLLEETLALEHLYKPKI